MTSASENENPVSREEKLAREQMGLDEDWKLVTVASAIPVGLDEQIDVLENDAELSDDERWQELDVDSAPLAWLPKGLLLVTMKKGTGDSKETKAGFIRTHNDGK